MHWEPWWPKSGTLEINFEFRDLYIFTLDLSKHVYEWMNEHFWPLFRKQCSQAICRFLFWFEVFLHFSKDRPIKAFQDNEPVANYFTYSINPTSQLKCKFLQINVLRDVNGQTVYFILDFQKYFELDFVQVLHVLKKKNKPTSQKLVCWFSVRNLKWFHIRELPICVFTCDEIFNLETNSWVWSY